jgi:Sulfotransferase family
MAIKPIFIFSISRSGSTLLQRVIARHDGVATVSEPWLLLPYAYTLRPHGIDAEYLHPMMVQAIEDFAREMPRGIEDYRDEVRTCVLRLYEKAAGPGAAYFLDKTPPYCLVAEEIMSLFPEGKFVFLWRNPLSVVASITRTWTPWHPTMFRQDLFVGLPRLLAAYEANRDRVHSVRFEELLGGGLQPWRALMEYLEIDFEPDALERFSQVKLNGATGDPTGVRQYASLSTEPLEKWRGELANPLRREWCRRYLRLLGTERLALAGYDADEILEELNAEPRSMTYALSDLGRLIVDVAKEPIRVRTRNRWLDSPNVLRALLNA